LGSKLVVTEFHFEEGLSSGITTVMDADDGGVIEAVGAEVAEKGVAGGRSGPVVAEKRIHPIGERRIGGRG
jgi:hypothetical protein